MSKQSINALIKAEVKKHAKPRKKGKTKAKKGGKKAKKKSWGVPAHQKKVIGQLQAEYTATKKKYHSVGERLKSLRARAK